MAYVVAETDMTIYVNGVATTNTTDVPTFDDGTYIRWDAASADRTIQGYFDEIRIWNTARTAQEIEANKLTVLNRDEAGVTYRIIQKASNLVIGERTSDAQALLFEPSLSDPGQEIEFIESKVEGQYFTMNRLSGYFYHFSRWKMGFSADTATTSDDYRFEIIAATTMVLTLWYLILVTQLTVTVPIIISHRIKAVLL